MTTSDGHLIVTSGLDVFPDSGRTQVHLLLVLVDSDVTLLIDRVCVVDMNGQRDEHRRHLRLLSLLEAHAMLAEVSLEVLTHVLEARELGHWSCPLDDG